MSVAYDPRPFDVDSHYAPVGEHDQDDDDADQDMNKYINTEANVDDMADLAAAAYSPDDDETHTQNHHHDHRAGVVGASSPSPFKMSAESPGAATTTGPASLVDELDPPRAAASVVDPADVPLRAMLPTPPRTLGLGLDSRVVGTRRTSNHNNHNQNGPRYSPSPRSKPIEKPSRMVTKNEAGMFECEWPDCKEEFKMFSRKCEWSKHMDKHERPYVCTVKGCEKIQGFTYSGGLLRHEREVHGKHGGPKKAFNCPHANCKRHNGKGFSRLENLQEHLRRVHTSNSGGGGGSGSGGDPAGGLLQNQQHIHQHSPVSDTASDVASAAFAVITGHLDPNSPADTTATSPAGGFGEVLTVAVSMGAAAGHKRKRSSADENDGHHILGQQREEESLRSALLHDNVALRQENEEMKREVEDLKRANAELRAQVESYQVQMDAVQAAISGLGVPSASVL